MYIVTSDAGIQGRTFYLSLSHGANKHGFPVYVSESEKQLATRFKTKKEARMFAGRGDKIIKEG